MSNVTVQPQVLDPAIQESIVLKGDLSGLSPMQKKDYYLYRCQQVGLDPAAKPFDLLTLNGKQVLYANASATQQLSSVHKLSTQITHRENVGDIYIVSCRVTGSDGRVSENQGAVNIGGLKGDHLANAVLKCTTKAIRRSVLAHVGLGMLDETEVETISEARKVNNPLDELPKPPGAFGSAISNVVANAVQQAKKDDVVEAVEIPVGTVYTLTLPNGEAADHPTYDAWESAYVGMIEKIAKAGKAPVQKRLDSIDQLKQCNLEVIEQLTLEMRMVLNTKVAKWLAPLRESAQV
jgi:hypothetical protein